MVIPLHPYPSLRALGAGKEAQHGRSLSQAGSAHPIPKTKTNPSPPGLIGTGVFCYSSSSVSQGSSKTLIFPAALGHMGILLLLPPCA